MEAKTIDNEIVARDNIKKKALPYIGIPVIAAAYLILKFSSGDIMAVIRSLTLVGFGYIAAYADLTTRKVPNKFILVFLASWLVFMSINVIYNIDSAINILVQSLISGAAAGGFFMFVYLISRGGIGGGDVKFIAVMGLFLTFAKLMQILLISSLLAVIASAILLIAKRATMKTAIPLIPFLYIGVLANLLL